MRTLLRNGQVLDGTPGTPYSAVAIDGDRIAAILTDDQAQRYDGADEVVDLGGAVVAPAFVDSHIHLVQTGFTSTQLDVGSVASRGELLERLSAYASDHPDDDTLLGQGWDETLWDDPTLPTLAEIERAAAGRRVALTRIDGHSALVSGPLADAVPGFATYDGRGGAGEARVERAAHHAVRDRLAELIGPDQRLAAARVGCRDLAAHGVVGFHENAAPHIGPEYEVDLVRRAADEVGLRATVYWGELLAVDTARRLGAAGLAGDLVADGALGSRTAALCTPYADHTGSAGGHRGHAYRTADEIAEHVELCTREGLQAGFHCIGDAALDAVGAGFRKAAAALGVDAIRNARHRLEHVEMPSPETIATLDELGIVASVQPMFDALWGGPERMYAERVGERWRAMNPFRALAATSGGIAFGSDCPVTPARPWAAVTAAVQHCNQDHALTPSQAFRAHTLGGWRAARDDDSGTISLGSRADLAVWRDLAIDAGGAPVVPMSPTLVRTIAAGRTIHPEAPQ